MDQFCILEPRLSQVYFQVKGPVAEWLGLNFYLCYGQCQLSHLEADGFDLYMHEIQLMFKLMSGFQSNSKVQLLTIPDKAAFMARRK